MSVVMSWIGGVGAPRRKRAGTATSTTPARRLTAARTVPRRITLGRASVKTKPISDATAAATPPYAPHLRRVRRATLNGTMPSRYPTGAATRTSTEAIARPAPNSTTHEMAGVWSVCGVAIVPLSHQLQAEASQAPQVKQRVRRAP